MHFFYLDETEDTGTDLENAEQPIFVLGGVTVSDNWRADQPTHTPSDSIDKK